MEELLQSLLRQRRSDFEVIVVEDGSTATSEKVVEAFGDRLKIHYIVKPNSGPGPSRNVGFQHATGQYFIVFDSDCIIRDNFFDAVDFALKENAFDAWGGPDRAHEDFTNFQRAVGYTMASPLTTGGIRGGKKRMGWFQPRSFNMGISRKVFETTGGFRFDRFAEDIEFSIRIRNAGFKVGLIPDAFVYHKRRTGPRAFFRQVFNFGKGRALVGKAHPQEVKVVHWFPTLFALSFVVLWLLPLISSSLFLAGVVAFVLYFVCLFIDCLRTTGSAVVAMLAVPSAFLQFFGYGIGFLSEKLRRSSAKNQPRQ